MGKRETFDILNDISEYVTLAKLMENLGNVDIAVTIACVFVFSSGHRAQVTCSLEGGESSSLEQRIPRR